TGRAVSFASLKAYPRPVSGAATGSFYSVRSVEPLEIKAIQVGEHAVKRPDFPWFSRSLVGTVARPDGVGFGILGLCELTGLRAGYGYSRLATTAAIRLYPCSREHPDAVTEPLRHRLRPALDHGTPVTLTIHHQVDEDIHIRPRDDHDEVRLEVHMGSLPPEFPGHPEFGEGLSISDGPRFRLHLLLPGIRNRSGPQDCGP